MVPAHEGRDGRPARQNADTVRQVIFLTDGEIGNEQELFDTISATRGRSHLFMVGIGSAPNSFLMTRAAELGRAPTPISDHRGGRGRMRALVEKLESPAVTICRPRSRQRVRM